MPLKYTQRENAALSVRKISDLHTEHSESSAQYGCREGRSRQRDNIDTIFIDSTRLVWFSAQPRSGQSSVTSAP